MKGCNIHFQKTCINYEYAEGTISNTEIRCQYNHYYIDTIVQYNKDYCVLSSTTSYNTYTDASIQQQRVRLNQTIVVYISKHNKRNCFTSYEIEHYFTVGLALLLTAGCPCLVAIVFVVLATAVMIKHEWLKWQPPVETAATAVVQLAPQFIDGEHIVIVERHHPGANLCVVVAQTI